FAAPSGGSGAFHALPSETSRRVNTRTNLAATPDSALPTRDGGMTLGAPRPRDRQKAAARRQADDGNPTDPAQCFRHGVCRPYSARDVDPSARPLPGLHLARPLGKLSAPAGARSV